MNTQRVEGYTPTPEGKLKIFRCVRRECVECGEPATKYQGYLLPNARSNPASKGYRGDDISWCVDADAYFCDACHSPKGYAHTPPKGYTNGSTWTYGDRFQHMFFHYVEDKEASANIERLEKVKEALVRALEAERDNCVNCNGDGFYRHISPGCEPESRECERCFSTRRAISLAKEPA